jgi:hemerythrin-like domain-containing protein
MAKARRATKSAKPARSTTTARKRVSATQTALTRAAAAAGTAVGKTVASVAGRVMPAGPHDPIEMLERDHRRLEALFKKGEATTTRGTRVRRELLDALTAALAVHERIEEKVLYPALKRHADAREIVLEGYQEHHVADVLVRELHRMPPTDERWGAKLKVLKENIEHHIEEEEGDMFKTARSVLTRAQLDALGRQMEAMKADAAKTRPRRTARR